MNFAIFKAGTDLLSFGLQVSQVLVNPQSRTSVEEQLFKLGCSTFVLDGDNVRHGLCSDLGFSDDDRKENIRRIGETGKLMFEQAL